MSEKFVAWGGEGCRCVPARDRLCHGILSAACPLGAAAALCAAWQVGVWRRGEYMVPVPGALEQVIRGGNRGNHSLFTSWLLLFCISVIFSWDFEDIFA